MQLNDSWTSSVQRRKYDYKCNMELVHCHCQVQVSLLPEGNMEYLFAENTREYSEMNKACLHFKVKLTQASREPGLHFQWWHLLEKTGSTRLWVCPVGITWAQNKQASLVSVSQQPLTGEGTETLFGSRAPGEHQNQRQSLASELLPTSFYPDDVINELAAGAGWYHYEMTNTIAFLQLHVP